MFNRNTKILPFLMGILLLTIFMGTACFANSAEPPSIIIIAQNPPENLSIQLKETGAPARAEKRAWETYYTFYSHDLRGDGNYTLEVSGGEEPSKFEVSISPNSYRSTYTLDLNRKVLKPGKQPFRSVVLVIMRILFTLLLESLIFYLFGFREKRSWIDFIVINLVTQGLLNIWLDSVSFFQSYLIIPLFLGEFFVFLTEMIAFSVAIREHKLWRRIGYAFIANLVSLVAGGFMITLLPV